MKYFFWTHDRPPTWREYPGVVLRVALFGLLTGPLWGTLFNLLFAQPLAEAFLPFGRFLWMSSLAGAAYVLSFYCACRLPWLYLGPVVKVYPAGTRRVIFATVGALGGMVGITLSSELISLLPGAKIAWSDHFGSILAGEAVLGAAIALVIGTIKTLNAQVRVAEAKIHEKEMRECALAEAAAKAQATALQAQINPHFFFNTLNTLSALIPMDQEAALEVVGRLADMFRYTLACSQAQKVTLAQELEFVGNYLKIEQARFSRRLSVTMPAGEFHDIVLPGLSLQPLVENAIRHGIAKRVEGGAVEISVHRNGKSCSVDVFSPPSATPVFFREGHALANIRDRLQLQAGGAANVDIAQDGAGRMRVSLVLPL
ncbi:MAG: histidine kinase internal region [Bryobacterales bacterium]|nr:histidine kinase internal region [Bryobacterales bacterium]